MKELSNIGGIHAVSEQSSFIIAELLSGLSAKELTKCLLTKYHMIVKDLSDKECCKGRQLLRFALRTQKENQFLLQTLKSEIIG